MHKSALTYLHQKEFKELPKIRYSPCWSEPNIDEPAAELHFIGRHDI